jgi:hypothetical protein
MNGDKLICRPYQTACTEFPEISLQEFQRAIQLVDGRETYSGAHAAFRVLAISGRNVFLWLYQHFVLFRWFSEIAYTFTSRRRGFSFGSGSKLIVWLYRWLFTRLLGLIYLSAFISFGLQAEGLIGSNGILPLANYLSDTYQQQGPGAWLTMPSVFWLGASDDVIQWVCLTGVLASALIVINRGTTAMLILCYVLYLSLLYAGRVFMFYQWDMLLLEVGFLAIFLGSGSKLIVWLYRWLIFRFMFLGGVVKIMSGDSSWHDLTALTYHYETQPLPTALAWYFHQLPVWVHQFSTASVLFFELIIPFLFFMPRNFRLGAAFITVFLQTLIIISGNYNYFNLLTIIICLFLLDDRALRFLVPTGLVAKIGAKVETVQLRSKYALSGLVMLVAFIVSVTGLQLYAKISGEALSDGLRSYVLAAHTLKATNSYGPFSVMTRVRPEIIIEGSDDGVSWQAYRFRYKPGELNQRPTFIIPHQPRLDWQMWFAAYSSPSSQYWFMAFVQKLLEDAPSVTALLEHNPFPDKPPTYIRALLYQYQFTNWAQRRETGDWWQRQLIVLYMPSTHLRKPPWLERN